jgi:hypothetical protein
MPFVKNDPNINRLGRTPTSAAMRTRITKYVSDTDIKEILVKMAELAKDGDVAAAKVILSKVIPDVKATPAPMPPLPLVGNAEQDCNTILKALSEGQLNAEQASAMTALVEKLALVLELPGIESRLIEQESRS